jgi:hypothetical protein
MRPKEKLLRSIEEVNRRHSRALDHLANYDTKGVTKMKKKFDMVKTLTQAQYFAFDHPLVTTTILTAFFMTMSLIIALRTF